MNRFFALFTECNSPLGIGMYKRSLSWKDERFFSDKRYVQAQFGPPKQQSVARGTRGSLVRNEQHGAVAADRPRLPPCGNRRGYSGP